MSWPTGAEVAACVDKFREQVQRIAALEENWDSYGAPRIDTRCIQAAVKLWGAIPGFDDWTLVPGSDGGVQLERHADGLSYEFTISPREQGDSNG